MDITVYDSTQKQLIGYKLQCSHEELYCLLHEREGWLVKGNHRVPFKYDIIKRINGRNFIIKNSNMTIWVRTSEVIPPGAFGEDLLVVR